MSRAFDIRYRRFLQIAFAICLAITIYGYSNGWPVWQPLMVVALVPGVAFVVWMYTGRFKRYRFLFGIYGTLALAATFEAWEYNQIPESVAKSLDLPKPRGEPNLYFEYDLPAVEARLFPDSPDTMLLQAVQLNYCTSGGPFFEQHPFCTKYKDASPAAIRGVLEAALSKMPKTNEDIYYSYIDVLIHTGAEQTKIDAAAEQWKKLFPLSDRTDPRTKVQRPPQ